MRITMTIDDQLMRHAQDSARQRGQTLGEVIESCLRRELNAEALRSSGPRPTWSVDVPDGRELARLFTDDDSPRG